MEILEIIKTLKYGRLKKTPYRHEKESKMRKVLLDYMNGQSEMEVGNYVLKKGQYKDNPFVMIYDKGSWARRKVWIENNKEYSESFDVESRKQNEEVGVLFRGGY